MALSSEYPTQPSQAGRSCPFTQSCQLNNELSENQGEPGLRLPGYPRIPLKDDIKVHNFLNRQLVSKGLETMAPKLWWMSKQDSSSVSPLHRQAVKKRTIIITEDPKLHLTWIYDRIYIKPLPEYLMSHTMWETHLVSKNNQNTQQELLRRSALGFLRTYLLLVQHASDFRIAQQSNLQLLPDRITWKEFCDFSSRFDQIEDSEVSGRYHYGEIRLTRLNFYSKFLLHKWHFHRVESQYAQYFAQFYGPIIFVFAVISVFLSAVQVELAVEQIGSTHTWVEFQRASSCFGIGTLILSFGLMLTLAILLCYKFGKEWSYALKIYSQRRVESTKVKGNVDDSKIRSEPV